MYGIYAYIDPSNRPNVGIYTIYTWIYMECLDMYIMLALTCIHTEDTPT